MRFVDIWGWGGLEPQYYYIPKDKKTVIVPNKRLPGPCYTEMVINIYLTA